MPVRRSASRLARDRRRIGDLYLRGWLQADIAVELNLSQGTVSNDIATMQKSWREDGDFDFNEAKQKELAKIDTLERTYWEAWFKSLEDAETVRQEGVSLKEKILTGKVVRTLKGQSGDKRFLDGVEWCIDKRCKILGIDAPTEINLANKPGQALKVEDVGFTNEARIARMLELFDAARARRTGPADLGDKPTLEG